MRRWVALALAAVLCWSLPGALGAEAPVYSPWAQPYLEEAAGLGLLDGQRPAPGQMPATAEELSAILRGAQTALAKLTPQHTPEPLAPAAGHLRWDLMEGLYRVLKGCALAQESEYTAELCRLGVLQGDGTGWALERACTYEEAVVMATRLVLAEYDSVAGGAHGILWQARKGDNVLYLLGTALPSEEGLYPRHKTLREVAALPEVAVGGCPCTHELGQEDWEGRQTDLMWAWRMGDLNDWAKAYRKSRVLELGGEELTA